MVNPTTLFVAALIPLGLALPVPKQDISNFEPRQFQGSTLIGSLLGGLSGGAGLPSNGAAGKAVKGSGIGAGAANDVGATAAGAADAADVAGGIGSFGSDAGAAAGAGGS